MAEIKFFEVIDCMTCKHIRKNGKGNFVCDAFPDGIPLKMIVESGHRRKLPGQRGDVVYEPKKWLKEV
ncbi:MAG TPA: cytoplasmic protein [bacterium]|nr:cytoplasmic protein [bacterium]